MTSPRHATMRCTRLIPMFALLVLSPLPADAGRLIATEDRCPICATISSYYGVASTGDYVYHDESRFLYVFWPFTDARYLWSCSQCRYTAFPSFFHEWSAETTASVKTLLKSIDAPKAGSIEIKSARTGKTLVDTSNDYSLIPILARLEIAEQVLRVIPATSDERSHFYRVKALFARTAHEPELATKALQAALEYAERGLRETPPDNLKYAYIVLGTAQAETNNVERAKETFRRVLAEPKSQGRSGRDTYHDQLATEWLGRLKGDGRR